MNPSLLGLSEIDITTFSGAQSAMPAIDSAMEAILGELAKMGAQEKGFEILIRSNEIQMVEINAAKSRILDANMAQEVTNLAKGLIQQNLQATIKAQANLIPLNILTLLDATTKGLSSMPTVSDIQNVLAV